MNRRTGNSRKEENKLRICRLRSLLVRQRIEYRAKHEQYKDGEERSPQSASVLAALDQFIHECDHSDPDTFKVRKKTREWILQLDEIREPSAPPSRRQLCERVKNTHTTDGKTDGNSNTAASGESTTQQTSGLNTTNEDSTRPPPPGQKRKRKFEDEGKSSKQRKVSANTQRYDDFFGKQRGEAATPSRSQQSDMTGPKRNKKAPNPTAREASVNSSLPASKRASTGSCRQQRATSGVTVHRT
jgi:hypothetical protein